MSRRSSSSASPRLRAVGRNVLRKERAANFDPAASTQTFKAIAIEKGDLGRGFAAADRVIEGEYRVGHQEQLYIETNGVVAVPAGDGGIAVYGSMQCPYYVHRALKVL